MNKLVRELIGLILECCPLLHPKTSVEKQAKLNKLLEPFQIDLASFKLPTNKLGSLDSFASNNRELKEHHLSSRQNFSPSDYTHVADMCLPIKSRFLYSELDPQINDHPGVKEVEEAEENDANLFGPSNEDEHENYFKKQYFKKPNISGYFSTTNGDSPAVKKPEVSRLFHSEVNFDNVVRTNLKSNAQVQTETNLPSHERKKPRLEKLKESSKKTDQLKNIVQYSNFSGADFLGQVKGSNSSLSFFINESVRIKANIPEAKVMSARNVMQKKLDLYRGSKAKSPPAAKNYISKMTLDDSVERPSIKKPNQNVSLREMIKEENNFDQESIHYPYRVNFFRSPK